MLKILWRWVYNLIRCYLKIVFRNDHFINNNSDMTAIWVFRGVYYSRDIFFQILLFG